MSKSPPDGSTEHPSGSTGESTTLPRRWLWGASGFLAGVVVTSVVGGIVSWPITRVMERQFPESHPHLVWSICNSPLSDDELDRLSLFASPPEALIALTVYFKNDGDIVLDDVEFVLSTDEPIFAHNLPLVVQLSDGRTKTRVKDFMGHFAHRRKAWMQMDEVPVGFVWQGHFFFGPPGADVTVGCRVNGKALKPTVWPEHIDVPSHRVPLHKKVTKE